jgi:hypothetical protein
MISLAGLSAVAPGYAAAEDQTAKTQVNQTKARDAAIKLIGANVLGSALTAGNGPQAPPPGQASVPAPRPVSPPAPPAAIPPQGAPPVPQGGASVPTPAPQPAPAVPAPQAAGAPASGKMGLQPMIAQILRTSPGVANHPEVLLAALTHAKDLGLLDPEAEDKVDEATKAHTATRVSLAKGHLKAVQDAAAGTPAPAPANAATPPAPTATDPKTGAKVQWDGKAWQPIPTS